jgi:hypothetical protein
MNIPQPQFHGHRHLRAVSTQHRPSIAELVRRIEANADLTALTRTAGMETVH